MVICIGIKPNIQRLFAPIAKQYGFIGVDASFIHEIKGRENPYYAFRDYPEYDALQAAGAVEFRTHPNDQGHAAIAEAILQASREALSRIPAGRFAESYSYAELLEAETPARLEIQTVPQMTVSYFGFNVRQSGECVTFGSAPGTGASLSARDFCVPYGCKRFYIELAIDGATEKDELLIELTGTDGTHKAALPVASGMHVYETAPVDALGTVVTLRVSTSAKECVLTVRSLGFYR